MFESLTREPAIEKTISPLTNGGLKIVEIIDQKIALIQPNNQFDLSMFSQSVFSREITMGKMLIDDQLRLIQLSPKSAYLIGNAPQPLNSFNSMITDISHGYCQLELSGQQAFKFINSYTPAYLNNNNIAQPKTAKTLLGHFNVILWWDSHDKIKLLIDRSYAQSFNNYLHALIRVWQTI
jgi:heterotetrameric sarcosine oxidase gamma subunit